MMHKINVDSITLPAGKYFVGDPCYAIPADSWQSWLEEAGYMEDPRYLVADVETFTCVGVGTAHGDGVFEDQKGNSYPVDAGLIGAVPVQLLLPSRETPWGMTKMKFDADFKVSYKEGKITIGHLVIDTDPEDHYLHI